MGAKILKELSFLQNRRNCKRKSFFFARNKTEGIEKRGKKTARKTEQEKHNCIEKQEGLALLIRRVSDEK